MPKRTKEQGAERFEAFYESLYGSRWPSLREALLSPGQSIPLRLAATEPYYLDPASAIAALCLDLASAASVVDLCAAPGGKSLVLASQLPEGALLVCNERSATRRARLHRVLDEHLTEEQRVFVSVTGHDAAKWALYRPHSADRVLADVPCSSEQHVLQSAGALAEWSPNRTKRLAQGAYAIACAAADSLRPGGRMVYSTCALSPAENDEVIRRLVGRSRGALEGCDAQAAVEAACRRLLHDGRFGVSSEQHAAFGQSAPGEPTEFGWMIMPDRDSGMGPIYLALLLKADPQREASG
jgi:16S rRNA C967 or C1407 C5-methylase (RsmB/RsmF family)